MIGRHPAVCESGDGTVVGSEEGDRLVRFEEDGDLLVALHGLEVLTAREEVAPLASATVLIKSARMSLMAPEVRAAASVSSRAMRSATPPWSLSLMTMAVGTCTGWLLLLRGRQRGLATCGAPIATWWCVVLLSRVHFVRDRTAENE